MNISMNRNMLIFGLNPARCESKDQLCFSIRKNIVILMMLVIGSSNITEASVTCHGRFVNPITDICWSCILPISIGGLSIGKGSAPRKRDIKNPSSPLCACSKGGQPVPIPGISIGFWEPVRLVDVTRTPYCMVNLGGISLGSDVKRNSSYGRGRSMRGSGSGTHNAFYHLHYYVYPLIYWLELITDFICLESSSFDVAYMSEFDITWNDYQLQNLFNPETVLFGNPIAKAACGIDCASSTVAKPIDGMFWCAGCLGTMYPFAGGNGAHVGGIKTSSLLTSRIIAKMHRLGLAQETSTTDAKINGKICRKSRALKVKKSQYKLQLTSPRSSSSGLGCWPLGLSPMLYAPSNEYPYDGEDFGYLVWRKKNCCLF